MSNTHGNQPPQYKVGDIVNGHVLSPRDGWQPISGTTTNQETRAQHPQPQPQPQYKVGDVANGYVLTAENKWEPLPPFPSAPPAGHQQAAHPTHPGQGAPMGSNPAGQPKRPWYKRKRVLIPVAVIALFVIIGSINQPTNRDDDADAKKPAAVAEQPPVEEEPAAEPAPAPEPEPAPEVGTATNPMPQPYIAKGLLGGEKYSLTGRVAADAPDVTQWNMFNDPAPTGFKYVVVELTMTGIDKDGVEPSLASFDLTLSTPEGNTYTAESGVVLGADMPSMWEGPTLYPGSAYTGNMAFLVPDTASGFMLYDNGNYIAL